MTEAYKVQFKAQTLAQENAKAPTGRTVPPPAQRAATGLKSIGRETPKEVPGPRANTPLRWQVAGPLHAEQFPGEFRLVVVGPLPLLPVLVEALEVLVRLAKIQFTDPN